MADHSKPVDTDLLRDMLQQCRDWIFYAYHNVDSVTSGRVKAALPNIDKQIVALSPQDSDLCVAQQTVRRWHQTALAMRDAAIETGNSRAVEKIYFDAAIALPFYGTDPDPLPYDRLSQEETE